MSIVNDMRVQEKLVIQNFFSISEFNWDIKDFNILTGGMASGKSLSLKLIHFIEQVFGRNIFFSSISQESLTSEVFFSNVGEQFNHIFHSKDQAKDFLNTKISYTYEYTDDDGSIMTFDMCAKWNKTKKVLEWKSTYISERIETWRSFLGNSNTPDAARNARQQIYENISHDFADTLPLGVLFIPASRAIAAITTNSDIPDTYLSDFIQDKSFVLNFNNISDSDVNNLLYFKNVLVSSSSTEKALEFELLNGRKITPLELSSGQQELLYLLFLIKNLPNTTFRFGNTISIFIEEPSAHLFPQEQKNSIEYIVKIFRDLQLKRKERFFITTHSPYILNSINNMLKKGNLIKRFPGNQEEIDREVTIPHLLCEEISAYFIEKSGVIVDMLDTNDEYLNAEKIADISFSINEDTNKLTELNNKLLYENGVS